MIREKTVLTIKLEFDQENNIFTVRRERTNILFYAEK